jgi:proline dehydrogenase
MESRHWTDFTLDCLDRLFAAGHRHVGTVIQTRLHRSLTDLDRLPPGARVRLVIGIYREPGELALTDKGAMKERLLEFARTLLSRGHYVEFATHDDRYVRRFLDEVVAEVGVGPDRFEIQMLYGVPRQKLLRSLVEQGLRVRLYVPFAVGWRMAVAYLRRRLDEYPTMALLVLKNWFWRG